MTASTRPLVAGVGVREGVMMSVGTEKEKLVGTVIRENKHEKCDPHPAFSLERGDRAKRERDEADALAAERAETRGPQRVSRHFGLIFKRGVWFIQDERDE